MFDIKKFLPANLRAAAIALLLVFSAIGCRAHSKTGIAAPNAPVVAETISSSDNQNSKVKFTSVYTKLDAKTCQPLWKPENEEDEPPLLCDGFQNYKIYVQTHGIARFYVGREISKDADSWKNLELPSFLFTGGEPTIEWRLADGEPFACIVRAEFDKELFNPDEKGTANELVVQNLKGFAPISISIDAKKDKRANEEARRQADAGFRKL